MKVRLEDGPLGTYIMYGDTRTIINIVDKATGDRLRASDDLLEELYKMKILLRLPPEFDADNLFDDDFNEQPK